MNDLPRERSEIIKGRKHRRWKIVYESPDGKTYEAIGYLTRFEARAARRLPERVWAVVHDERDGHA